MTILTYQRKKLVKSTGIVYNSRHFTNLVTLKLVYYALVYPYLIYGNLIWGNTYKKRLQKLMNRPKENDTVNDF